MSVPLRVLSLGAGVQSSTVYLMMTAGELPRVDLAIFADTGDEPAKVYEWLAWLEQQSDIPVRRVSAGHLAAATLRVRTSQKTGRPYVKHYVPSYGLDLTNGGESMMPRKCTSDFKLVPIQRVLRELARPKRGEDRVLVEVNIGISYDELHRMRTPDHPWIRHVYPLVDRSLTRWHCLEWMRAHFGREPPRSACVYCPFHADREWIDLRDNAPADFQKAVEFERQLWAASSALGARQREFLHEDRVPLDQVQFREDRNKDLFGNECQGMCGV